MSVTISYIAPEHLRDGSPVEVRTLRPEVEADMLAALDQSEPAVVAAPIFAMKRHFTDKERAFFMDVDFSNHVALVVQEANWLPAPKLEFIPMLRMYWPKNESPSILNGSWKPPAVQKAS